MNRAVLASTCAAALAALLSPCAAGAASLYFEKAVVRTRSEATCLNFAAGVVRPPAFSSVHRGPGEVAGQKNGAYVSVTCVGRGQQGAVAVVMAIAESFDAARQLGRSVADQVKRVTCIDSPC